MANIFIKTTFKDPKPLNNLKLYIKTHSISVFLDITKGADSREIFKKVRGMLVYLYILWVFFRQGITVQTFIIV